MFQVLPVVGKSITTLLPSVLPSSPFRLVLPQGRSTQATQSLTSKHFVAVEWGSGTRVVAALPSLVTGLLNCLHLFPMELQHSPQKLN